jgi:hypothetical protein
MSYTNPADGIYSKINAYLKNVKNEDDNKTNAPKRGLLRSTKNTTTQNRMSNTPLSRVAKYVNTIRQERDKLNGS